MVGKLSKVQKLKDMQIIQLKVLNGPNYWNKRCHKLIILHLDLKNLAGKAISQIPGFYERLIDLLPNCVEDLEDDVMMSHVVQYVALQLQRLSRMDVGFGQVYKTEDNSIHQIAVEYLYEQAGIYSVKYAVSICQKLLSTIDNIQINDIQEEFEESLQSLINISTQSMLDFSTKIMVCEAEEQGIPWIPLEFHRMVQLGYGVNQRRILRTQTDLTGSIALELADDKKATNTLLRRAGISVPHTVVVYSLDELETAIESVGSFPIVIKPLYGKCGRGITVEVKSLEQAEEAYRIARHFDRSVIVERYYPGSDYRILVVNDQVVDVIEKIPACVIGDGQSTISELIKQTNYGSLPVKERNDMQRQSEAMILNWQLERQGYTLNTVLTPQKVCYVQAIYNPAAGGTTIARTDNLHPENSLLARRVAKLIGLDIAGIDLITPDISQPTHAVGGVVVDVNADPGLWTHVHAYRDKPQKIAQSILKMMFPSKNSSRIPIIAVTGTNGKTTTTRLIAHIFREIRRVVGFTTTDGIYIDDYLVEKGDNAGHRGAQVILRDPTVEVAVLETARGGILRSGLGFDRCNVAVILNITADHLGIDGINTLEELARLKSVVAESVDPSGYAILNADDPLVVEMANRVNAKVAYFTMNSKNEIVQTHLSQGGLAAIYEDGCLFFGEGTQRTWIERVVDVPLTMHGQAQFMIANVLAAGLAAFSLDIDVGTIRHAIKGFEPSVTQNPGRMNLFDLGHCHALIDYAHNLESLKALGSFVQHWSGKKIGVIGAPGDRRDEDLLALGQVSTQIFDQIFVKEDDDTRGRDRGKIAQLIHQGILQSNQKRLCDVILDEVTAINMALSNASQNSLVVILPEDISRTIQLVQTHLRFD